MLGYTRPIIALRALQLTLEVLLLVEMHIKGMRRYGKVLHRPIIQPCFFSVAIQVLAIYLEHTKVGIDVLYNIFL